MDTLPTTDTSRLFVHTGGTDCQNCGETPTRRAPAAGAFLPLFGWKLNPDLCALVHGLSSVCVVTNALRLNFVRLDRSPKPAALSS